jgi:hypothetical protein
MILNFNPSSAPLWQMIISKYHPTFLGTCHHAIEWSEKLAEEWLSRNMCENRLSAVKRILKEFSDHRRSKSHSRHISKDKCKEIGLSIVDMESDQELQDLLLTVHHSFMHTFSQSTAVKVVENHLGVAYVESLQVQFGQPFGQSHPH